MWWVFAVVIGLIMLGAWSHRAEKKEMDSHLTALERHRLRFINLAKVDQLPRIESSVPDYRPMRSERVHGLCNEAQHGDEAAGSKFGHGRLLITNQAVVFEGAGKNQRFPHSSISSVEIKQDGFVMKRRNGKHVPFRTGRDAETLALVDTILTR